MFAWIRNLFFKQFEPVPSQPFPYEKGSHAVYEAIQNELRKLSKQEDKPAIFASSVGVRSILNHGRNWPALQDVTRKRIVEGAILTCLLKGGGVTFDEQGIPTWSAEGSGIDTKNNPMCLISDEFPSWHWERQCKADAEIVRDMATIEIHITDPKQVLDVLAKVEPTYVVKPSVAEITQSITDVDKNSLSPETRDE